MATWITHLRLAEALLTAGLKVETDTFLIGSIAPDAGEPNAAGTAYEPPKRVTHWHDAQGEIDSDAYAARYLSARAVDSAAFSFHVGMYLHLVADVLWKQLVWRPKKQTPLYLKALANLNLSMHEIKRDWDGQDFLYLKANPESIFYRRFRYLDAVPDYLDYLPSGLLTKAVRRVQSYYRAPAFDLNRPYIYLSQAEIDAYVDLTLEKLTALSHERGWFTPR